jgi:DNA-binding SARP family transcriptional activator
VRFGVLNGVTVGGSLVERSQSAQLLALLLAHSNTLVSTSAIEDVLWDGQPAKAGSLHTAISRLRTLLPKDSLIRREDSYSLRVDRLDYDAFIFEDLATQGSRCFDSSQPEQALVAIDQALALWRVRPFSSYGNAPAMVHEVSRLVDIKAATNVLRLKTLLVLDHAPLAVIAATGQIAEHPFHEGIRVLHAQALSACGRNVEAVRALHDFRRFLREEVGLDPSREFADFERSLLAPVDSQPSSATTDDGSPHVQEEVSAHGSSASSIEQQIQVRPPVSQADGAERSFITGGTRAPERSRLASMLSACLLGARHAVLLEGPAGIGKSTIVSALSDLARGKGFRVLRGGFAPGTRIPMLGWRPLLDRPGDTALPGPASQDQIRRVIGQIDELLKIGPTMVVLEDAHWADDLSLEALSTVLLSGVGQQDSLFLAITRRTESFGQTSSGWIERLVRDRSLETVELKPLDLIDLADVVAEELGGRPSRQLISALSLSTAGNPLLAKASASQLKRAGQLGLVDDGSIGLVGTHGSTSDSMTGHRVPEVLTADIQAPYAAALGELTPATKEVLSFLAILGGQASLADLVLLSTHSAQSIVEALVPAEDLDLVHLSQDVVSFDHDLVRRSVLSRLSGSRRQLLHATVAHALCLQIPNPDQTTAERKTLVANQLQLAGLLGDAGLRQRWSLAAGNDAFEARLWIEAVRHLSYARSPTLLTGAETTSSIDANIELKIGTAKYYALDPSARVSFQLAIDLAQVTGDQDTFVQAALGLHRQSCNLRQGVENSERLVLAIARNDDHSRLSRIRTLTQLAEFSVEQTIVRADLAEEAQSLLRPDDPIDIQSAVHFSSGIVNLEIFNFSAAKESLRLAQKFDNPLAPGVPCIRLASIALIEDNPIVALQLLGPTEEANLVERRYWFELAVFLSHRAAAHALVRDFENAISDARSALRWAQLCNSLVREQQAILVAGFVALETGEPLHSTLGAYELPRTLELLKLICSSGHGNENQRLERTIVANLTLVTGRRNLLESTGIMLEWLARNGSDRGQSSAVEIIERFANAGVRTFLGWPRRLQSVSKLLV